MLQEIFQSRVGIIIISVIWGLGLSTLFRKACQGRTCQIIKYTGPNPYEIEKTYYNYGTGQCYQFHPVLSKCLPDQ